MACELKICLKTTNRSKGRFFFTPMFFCAKMVKVKEGGLSFGRF